MITRSYVDLALLQTFDERFNYLVLIGSVGESTFGFDRYINQAFYRSREWKTVRDHVIVRDNGCDLGVPGYDIHSELLVHHMNPLSVNDIVHNEDWILDPNFLITTCIDTHNAIHYGGKPKAQISYAIRTPGDTNLWGR